MELADTSDLGSDTSCVWVRVPLPPPYMSAYSNFIFLWNQLVTDLTKQRRSVKNKHAGMDGIGRHGRLKICCPNTACGFESHYQYHGLPIFGRNDTAVARAL